MAITRRDILKNMALSAAATSVLRIIPAQAAEYAHAMIAEEKNSAAGTYVPKFFSPPEYKTLQALCNAIIPADDRAGGAVEAGAPEFIDLLTSENPEYQRILGGGLIWLDAECAERFGATYLESSEAQKKEMLDLIAYERNAKLYPTVSQAVGFFAMLRNLTCDGYFTSKIGIKDLQYMGNEYLAEFTGCPALPEA
jgi:gluconate 2-dehydrogenase subunit 3-like protein